MAQTIGNLGRGAGLRQSRSSYIAEGLVSAFNTVQNWIERSRTRGHLYQMPEYMLRDIGVSRVEVEREWEKPFWKA
ncbi:MAG TPA: DUF1127 domain-containing protein [Candidatus Cybelea sp.]|nr:DUF1127 domain-containing protein [Candidatus Cybelea sp.]